MSKIIDFLALPLSLPISPIWDFIICLIIGEVAYRIAYSLSGEYGHSSRERYFLHWFIRIPLYFIIWCIICLIITIVNVVRANWVIVLISLGAILVISLIILIIVKLKRRKK